MSLGDNMENSDLRLTDNEAEYLLSYINNVLIPSSDEFFNLLDENEVKLHHAFSFNAIVTHAIDYMVFIAKKTGRATRTKFIKEFDEKYYIEGSVHINNKFRLLDAINNSFKHVELDKSQSRYADLIRTYGELTFHSLKENDGKIFFDMPSYKFDYCRVVLKPVAAIFNCGLETTQDVIDFINGDICGCVGYGHFDYDYEPEDAIDRMIDHCNPQCLDCGEGTDECDCPNFVYGNKQGDFVPATDPFFDFDDVMSQISGSKKT